MPQEKTLRVAIIHDWLVTYRGGERVLEALCEIYPDAPIYTLFYDKRKLPESLKNKKIIYPKSLNSLKFMRKLLLPFLPQFIEEFDLSRYDLVVSSSSCVAKGVIPAPHSKHICYIHSPMRYIWDQKKFYFQRLLKLPFLGFLLSFLLKSLRIWDVTSSARVDLFLSNSSFVKERVKRYYRRESEVLPPPSDLNSLYSYKRSGKKREHYLILGALVSYKSFDLAIRAFNQSTKTLFVVGEGPESKSLKKLAKPNIIFKGHLPTQEVYKVLAEAKALIFPGTEDFGLTAIESLALGTPVLAHKSGGALDFIKEGENGFFFEEKKTSSLLESIRQLESSQLSEEKIRESARPFSKENFKKSFKKRATTLIQEEDSLSV